jgi:hypothetical protein
MAEGVLPNCARLLDEAVYLDVTPTLPALTAPGWLTIASGAHPGTLCVNNILQPVPGAAPDQIRNGFDRRLSRGEYLWETLAARGLPAVVVKYPGSWPPRRDLPALVQVDGAGGYADITCRFEEVSSAVYLCGVDPPAHQADGCCTVPRGYDDHWRVDGSGGSGALPVAGRTALGWRGLPPELTPVFEAVLPVQRVGQRRRALLHALAGIRGGRPRLLLAWSKDHRDAVAELAPGDWSDWICQDGPRGRYAFRVKLLELDPARRRLRLYRSEGHRTGGFTVPEALADDLVAAAGPVSEWTGTFDYMNGLVDLDTQLEIYDRHTARLERVLGRLAAGSWFGFFTHWHVIEYAHHIAGAALDRTHPRH